MKPNYIKLPPEERRKLPRGIRNNNPGNIRDNGIKWQGQVPDSQRTDKEFLEFLTFADGVRAKIMILRNYIANGFNTPVKMFNRYAPASDNNNTNVYIQNACKVLGIGPFDKIEPTKANFQKLAAMICSMENGKEWTISLQDFEDGWAKLPDQIKKKYS